MGDPRGGEKGYSSGARPTLGLENNKEVHVGCFFLPYWSLHGGAGGFFYMLKFI